MNHCIPHGASSLYGVRLLAVGTGSGVTNSTLPWAIGLQTKKISRGIGGREHVWDILGYSASLADLFPFKTTWDAS